MLEKDPTNGIAQDNLEAIEYKMNIANDLEEEPPKKEVMSRIISDFLHFCTLLL